MVLALAALLWTLILANPLPGGRAVFDQDYYHLRVVHTFAKDWPNFDLANYRSATTPGYHLLLAGVARFIADSTSAVRIAGSLFTLAFVALLGLHVARRVSPAGVVALLAPLCTCLYIIGPGAWLLPDNAAWLMVLALLILALDRQPDARTLALAGFLLLALVSFRQIHLWAAGLVWLSAWLGASASPWPDSPLSLSRERPRLTRAALAFAATIPAALIVLGFARLWRGMVPPLFQPGSPDPVFRGGTMRLTGGNPATPAFLLMLVAINAVFYVGWWWPAIERLRRRDAAVIRATLIGALIGLVLGVVPQTSFNMDLGRYTGYWAIVRKFPDIADRSPIVIAGAVAGGAFLGLLATSLRPRDAWILLAALAGFTIAQATSAFAWQRYLEPMVFLVLILAASRLEPAPTNHAHTSPIAQRLRLIGPIVLAGILAIISWRQLSQLPDIAGAA